MNNNVTSTWRLVGLIFFIATTVALIGYLSYKEENLKIAKNEIGMLKSKVVNLKEAYIDMRNTNDLAVKENITLVIEMRDMRAKIQSTVEYMNSEISGVNLKYSIVSYIKNHYSRSSTLVATAIAENIATLSRKYNVAPGLVVAIIEEESWFNPQATNKKSGAIGLMQVMEEWIPKLKLKSRKDLYEIDINIESGIKILKIHIKENKGSISKALYHYVNGDKSYVDKVYRSMGRFTIYRYSLNQLKDKPKD